MSLKKPSLGSLLVKALASLALVFLIAGGSSETYAQARGGFADKRMQDFQLRRACEENLPTCLPQVRRQIEQERRNNMWLGAMIVGVLILVSLLVVRANRQKQIEQQQILAKGRQAARQRKEQRRKAKQEESGDEEFEDGLADSQARSTIERPPGFNRR